MHLSHSRIKMKANLCFEVRIPISNYKKFNVGIGRYWSASTAVVLDLLRTQDVSSTSRVYQVHCRVDCRRSRVEQEEQSTYQTVGRAEWTVGGAICLDHSDSFDKHIYRKLSNTNFFFGVRKKTGFVLRAGFVRKLRTQGSRKKGLFLMAGPLRGIGGW